MATQVTLVAALYVNAGHEREFEQFESAAAQIMARYGGRIERRIRCDADSDPAQPFEVHLLTFPDLDSFERYRLDPELARLAELRARAIRATTVWRGAELKPYKIE